MSYTIAEFFQHYFEMLPASTEALKESVYRLRYEVFCQEMGYWDPDIYSDGMERDEHDEHAVHFLIRHRGTGIYAATTRLILPHPGDPQRPFPIEEHSQIDRFDLLEGVDRSKLAEASRFCVSERFKRREGEKHTPAGMDTQNINAHPLYGENHRHTLPNFSLPLLACLVRMSIHNGITHWYAFMEPAFARLFRGLGIIFIPVGPMVDHCGLRRPYVIKLSDLLAGAKSKDNAEWEILTNHGKFWHDNGADAEGVSGLDDTPPSDPECGTPRLTERENSKQTRSD